MTNYDEENLPQLPEWLESLLPEHIEPQVLSLTEDGKRLALSYAGNTREFDTLQEAYDALRENDLDLLIDDAVYPVFGEDNLRGLGLSLPSEEDGFTTMVMSFTDEDRHNSLRRGYKSFLEIAENYSKNPSDFATAWEFINSHPAFWVTHDVENSPWNWSQGGHMSKVTQWVGKTKLGKTFVSLETGSHVEKKSYGVKAYATHYGDWRLEVSGLTFEEAVIKLASRVAICFDNEGNDKPDAGEILESVKPEWVYDLESRLADTADAFANSESEDTPDAHSV